LEALECRAVPSTVTNLDDAGAGSLRQAILDTPSGGTVDFQPGLTGTITLTSGQLDIDKDLTVAGPGADVITVSGNMYYRVFEIATPNVSVTISALTIAHGYTYGNAGSGIQSMGNLTLSDCVLNGNEAFAGAGGAISSAGTLTVSDCVLSDNQAQSGGGIYNYRFQGGLVTITRSTLRDNSATFGSPAMGGGIYNNGGTLILTDSTVSGNISSGSGALSALSEGGGILNNGTMTAAGSTLSGNVAGASVGNGSAFSAGGAVYNSGDLSITNSTIRGNGVSAGGILMASSGSSSGGGIYNTSTLTIVSATLTGNSASNSGHGNSIGGGTATAGGGVTTARNILLAANSAGTEAPDVSGTLESQGYNLIGDSSGGSGFVDTDLVGTADNPIDPKLGPLQDNGGPTLTMALLPGSPALDTGDPAQFGTVDQRGVVRAGGVNIGAYQASASVFVLAAPPKVMAGTPFDVTVTAVDPFGQLALGYTGTVTFSTTDPDPGVVLPADYAFTAADGATHVFTDTGRGETTLLTRGHQTITATDTSDGSILASVTVRVRHARHASPQLSAVTSRAAIPSLVPDHTPTRQAAQEPSEGQPIQFEALLTTTHTVPARHVRDAAFGVIGAYFVEQLPASVTRHVEDQASIPFNEPSNR
jgi:hypothetical protein